MPRVRFTVRRMMIAVAIVALAFGWLGERRSRFLRKAAYYRNLNPPRGHSTTTSVQRMYWSIRHARKYERAASHPWLPVSPDKPMPEDIEDPPDY